MTTAEDGRITLVGLMAANLKVTTLGMFTPVHGLHKLMSLLGRLQATYGYSLQSLDVVLTQVD